MSEQVRSRFLASADRDEAQRVAAELIAEGHVADLVETLLDEVGSGDAFRREQVLSRLDGFEQAPQLVAPLVEALRDTDRVQRRNAARSTLARLSRQGRVSARLAELAATDADRDVRILAATALGESEAPTPELDGLIEATRDDDPNVVAAAVESIAAHGDVRALPRLTELARADDQWVRGSAIVALGELGDPSVLPVLVEAIARPQTAPLAADAIRRIGDASVIDSLQDATHSDARRVARVALDAAIALAAIDPATPKPEWLRTAAAERVAEAGGDRELDAEFARLLGVAGTPAAARRLVEAAGEPDRWPEIVVGLELLPEDVRVDAVLDAVDVAPPETAARLAGVLPSIESADAIRKLAEQLSYADANVRRAVEDALLRSNREAVFEAVDRIGGVGSPDARLAAARVLARLEPERCSRLADLLHEDTVQIRMEAARALASCQGSSVIAQLMEALDAESEPAVRLALVDALGAAGGAAAVERLGPLAESHDEDVRFAAAQALGKARDASALRPLLRLIDDDSEAVRHAALRALGELGDPRAADPVGTQLGVDDHELRRTAARALEELGNADIRPRLLSALSDEDWQVRLSAVRALGMVAAPEDLTRLRSLAERDPDPLVRREARAAVEASDDT